MAPVFLWSAILVLLFGGLALWDAVVRRPSVIARKLRAQGVRVLPYRPLSAGHAFEIGRSTEMARSSVLPAPPASNSALLTHLHPFLVRNLQLTHGESFIFWWGPKPRFLITKPEDIKKILSTEFKNYAKVDTLVKILRRMFGYGILLAEGQDWHNQRNIVRPAFYLEKIKMMVPNMHFSTIEMVNVLSEAIESSGGSSCEVDIAYHLKNVTGDILARTCFGSDYKVGKGVFQKQDMLVPIVMKQALMHLMVPGYKYLPLPSNIKSRSLERSIEKQLYEIVKPRLEAIQKKGLCEGSPSQQRNDLLGLMLVGDGVDGATCNLSANQVMDQCKTFFFAGQETTSNMLCWTIMLLSVHPEWQEKLRHEVMEVCAIVGTSPPHAEQLNKLRLMSMVLNEALRLYPPVPELSPRTQSTSGDNVKLGEVEFPSGVGFCFLVSYIHRDKELWGKDADDFNPERFNDGVSKACKHPFGFLPFGMGPRVCIGQSFAMMEAKVIMVAILQRFRFRLSPKYVHCPESLITLSPKYGMQVYLEPL